jgi:hypothetical protein
VRWQLHPAAFTPLFCAIDIASTAFLQRLFRRLLSQNPVVKERRKNGGNVQGNCESNDAMNEAGGAALTDPL